MSAFSNIQDKQQRGEDLTSLEFAVWWCSDVVAARKAAEELADKDAELAALRERVKVLEEAIKPFAEIPCLENFDDDQLFDPAGGVLAGDVRKARAALRGEA